MEKDSEYEIRITDYTTDGEGIGHVGTFPLFVKDTCIGDTVLCRVMKAKKTYGYAKLIRVTEPSSDRVTPPCEKAKSCGGCQLQALSYEAQCRFKEKKVQDDLLRIGKFHNISTEPIVCMEDPWHYRNKAQVPFGKNKDGEIVYGFFAGRTHDIIPMPNCLLTPESFSQYLNAIKEHLLKHGIEPYDEETGAGLLRHVLIRKAYHTDETLICLILNGRKMPYIEELMEKFPECLWFINVNQKQGNTILGTTTKALSRKSYIEDRIGEITFHISPQSFYQVNPVMTEKLYGKAIEYAGLTGAETVWDVYCGIGTIALSASKYAKKVYGVEIVSEAIRDAEENAAINGITNAEFFTGKAEEILPKWHSENSEEKIDVVFLDPPRKGCDERCIQTVIQMNPERIVYVSCDPATLSRDLRMFVDGGYTLEKVAPHDMFPMTEHVECVCLLTRNN